MRRERKIEQKQERFLAKQEERRQRKMSSKDSLPRPYHLGGNAAAEAGEQGMKTSLDAVEQENCSQPGSDDSVPRSNVARWALLEERA